MAYICPHCGGYAGDVGHVCGSGTSLPAAGSMTPIVVWQDEDEALSLLREIRDLLYAKGDGRGYLSSIDEMVGEIREAVGIFMDRLPEREEVKIPTRGQNPDAGSKTAADAEIARLREEVEAFRRADPDHAEWARVPAWAKRGIESLRAEVERLTRDLKIEREHNPARCICAKCGASMPCESCAQYQEEVERLKRERDEARSVSTQAHVAGINRLRAERNALNAALARERALREAIESAPSPESENSRYAHWWRQKRGVALVASPEPGDAPTGSTEPTDLRPMTDPPRASFEEPGDAPKCGATDPLGDPRKRCSLPRGHAGLHEQEAR